MTSVRRPIDEDTAQFEVLLCWFRYAVAALGVLMAILLHADWLNTAIAVGLAAVAVNGYVHASLPRTQCGPAMQRLGRRVLAADVVLTVVTYLLLLNDPDAIPVAFMPLLVLELAARYKRLGAIVGLGAFTVAVAIRVAHQLWLIPGGSVRPPLLLVWILFVVLLLLLSRELNLRDVRERAVIAERERIAASFRSVVGELLARCGVPPAAASSTDVLETVRRICEERSTEYEALAASIADRLVPAAQEFGLTRREREIVGLLAIGYSYERIAKALFVSASTVRNHVQHARAKLGLSSRDELVAFARVEGLAPTGTDGADVR